jgi:hypothetical protein
MRNNMKIRHTSAPALDRQLDLLVDGELNEPDRVELLRRIETEPDGWRRCALAFLEGQGWRQALEGHVYASLQLPGTNAALPAPAGRRVAGWRQPLALAAGMLLMFGLGWILRPAAPALDEVRAGAQTSAARPVEIAPGTGPQPTQVAEAATNRSSEEAEAKPAETESPRIPYRAETHSRFASIVFKDGKRIQVPLQQVRLRYVGSRTY